MSFFQNPMIRKELRQRLRERRAWVLPTIYVLLLSSVVLFAYSERPAGQANAQGADIGTSIFFWVIFAQAIVLLLVAPVFSAGGITIEKEQRTFASLLTTLLSPGEIWWGKFVSSLLYLLLLLSCSIPLLALSFAFGGVDPKEVLVATGYSILVLAAVCSLGLLCSGLFRRSVHSTAAAYGLVLLLTIVTTILFAYMESHWRQGGHAVRGEEVPVYIHAPLLFNPLYPLLSLGSVAGSEFPYAASSCLLFGAMLLLAAAFTMRLLKRSGEQA